MNFHFNYDSLKLYRSSSTLLLATTPKSQKLWKQKLCNSAHHDFYLLLIQEKNKIANQNQEVSKLALKLLGISVDFHTLMDFNVYAFPLLLIQIKLSNYKLSSIFVSNFYVFIRASKRINFLSFHVYVHFFLTWYLRTSYPIHQLA